MATGLPNHLAALHLQHYLLWAAHAQRYFFCCSQAKNAVSKDLVYITGLDFLLCMRSAEMPISIFSLFMRASQSRAAFRAVSSGVPFRGSKAGGQCDGSFSVRRLVIVLEDFDESEFVAPFEWLCGRVLSSGCE